VRAWAKRRESETVSLSLVIQGLMVGRGTERGRDAEADPGGLGRANDKEREE
jgi:hypothetical protein